MADLSPDAYIALGVAVGLVSTCVQSFGLTLQRKSHILEDEKEDDTSRRAPYRRRRWQIGMLLFLIANVVGSSIQITTLPLPLLSTLQASGLVFNSIMATVLLKEPWTWRTGFGTLLVVGGAFLISWFSAVPEPSHTLNQLIGLLSMRSFLVWFIMSLLFTVAVLSTTFFLQFCVSAHRRQSARTGLVRGMCYGLISGVLSAHALLLAKSAVELVVTSVKDKVNEFGNYRSWLLLLAFMFLALTQLYYLHRGLKLVSTSILYPFVFCVYNIVAILDGIIYFRQTDRLSPLQDGLIALGTVVLLAGVLALSWLQDAQEGDSETDHPMTKAEIPQTVLAPGMGFVGDPADDTTNDSTGDSSDVESESFPDFPDFEDAADEQSALLREGPRPRKSSNMSRRRSVATENLVRKRKRAATLKELREIWAQHSDSDQESHYGTFHRLSRSTTGLPPATNFQDRVKRLRGKMARAGSHDTDSSNEAAVDDSPPAGQDDELTDHHHASLQRARTMPNAKDHRNGRRRRSSSARQRPPSGGALFSDLLKRGWWLPHGEKEEDEDMDRSGYLDTPTPPKKKRPASRDSRAKVHFFTEGESSEQAERRDGHG